MKWQNKGHEFDVLGERFINDPHIYIYGAGDYGKKQYELLEWLEIECSFIDGNQKKQKEGYLGKRVLSPIEFFLEGKKNVVLAAVPSYANEMKLILEEHGYEENVHFWTMEEFGRKVLPIYMSYVKNKVYMDSIVFLSTTVCNLNCDACLNFTSYNKQQRHETIEERKQTLDEYFRAIDYVRFMSYTGGEPLLYPQVDELLEYIGSNYSNQIFTLGMSTNGTIIPKDTTCEILKKYHFLVLLDDYSVYVEPSREIIPKIFEKLRGYNVSYQHNVGTDVYWIDFAPFETDNTYMSEDELIEYKKCCEVPYRELREGKLYSCNYASFAMKAGIQGEDSNDWYDLKSYVKENDKELIEFIMGYTEKGYVDFCKHCAGFLPINPYKKPVGRQIERK